MRTVLRRFERVPGRPAPHLTPVRAAPLADPGEFPLAPVDASRDPWPGEFLRLAGGDVFVRKTPPAAVAGSNEYAQAALYIHGLGGASTNFTDLADLVSPWLDGHALDLPGFGSSGPPIEANYSIGAHARVVIAYLEASGRGPVHLVGNSMGGAIAIRVAYSRPDLVRTLTLISPAVPDLRTRGAEAMLMPLLLVPGVGTKALRKLDQTSAHARAKSIIELCFAHPELVPAKRLEEAVQDVVERRQKPWAHDAMLSSLRGLLRTYLARGPRSPWNQLGAIAAPSLVIWGARDKLVSAANAPKVARALADASVLVLPEVGHTAQLEDPATTARALLALVAAQDSEPVRRGEQAYDALGMGA